MTEFAMEEKLSWFCLFLSSSFFGVGNPRSITRKHVFRICFGALTSWRGNRVWEFQLCIRGSRWCLPGEIPLSLPERNRSSMLDSSIGPTKRFNGKDLQILSLAYSWHLQQHFPYGFLLAAESGRTLAHPLAMGTQKAHRSVNSKMWSLPPSRKHSISVVRWCLLESWHWTCYHLYIYF